MLTPSIRHEIREFLIKHKTDYEYDTGEGVRIDTEVLSELVYEWAMITGFKLGREDAKREYENKKGIKNG